MIGFKRKKKREEHSKRIAKPTNKNKTKRRISMKKQIESLRIGQRKCNTTDEATAFDWKSEVLEQGNGSDTTE